MQIILSYHFLLQSGLGLDCIVSPQKRSLSPSLSNRIFSLSYLWLSLRRHQHPPKINLIAAISKFNKQKSNTITFTLPSSLARFSSRASGAVAYRLGGHYKLVTNASISPLFSPHHIPRHCLLQPFVLGSLILL
ncbi:hypothetical protein L873DRAFT_69935 [Choiromyces venosus 120613-1]|uniref:Uncharacterized protein n=1 Tax=Choiromyces venosus 120613-1 TaxID=1336337 RepID=A0A3N4J4Q8_9PEZI|nr:hypothetical protein L873DRAFT_69935 [Choiromyces venosus 120613-1]